MPATLDEHYSYLTDKVKLARYEAAIAQVVEPGQTVMDLGCGSGLLGLMALRAGAGQVLFVEEGPIIEVARRAVDEAGFSDRTEYHNVNSFELSLAETVDVVVCDHIGYFGFDYSVLSLLEDARRRFLKPGGSLIPSKIDLELAPVESEDSRKLVQRWRNDDVHADFHWVHAPAANAKHGVDQTAENLLAKPADIASLVLGEPADDFLTWESSFNAARAGTLDGLLGWFDCTLADDIRMTNSPTADEALDRPQAFFPLEEPVEVAAGETINAKVMARHLDHIIAWIVELPEQNKRFSLTTFNSLFIDNTAMDQGRPDRIAQLNSRGLARQIVLSYCDGRRTVAEVEALVMQAHPDLFPSPLATRAFVRSVLTSDTGA